jgi:hypothetical protein
LPHRLSTTTPCRAPTATLIDVAPPRRRKANDFKINAIQ